MKALKAGQQPERGNPFAPPEEEKKDENTDEGQTNMANVSAAATGSGMANTSAAASGASMAAMAMPGIGLEKGPSIDTAAAIGGISGPAYGQPMQPVAAPVA